MNEDPPAEGLNWSPEPLPITIGVAGIVATPLKPWIPLNEVETRKGMPEMGMSPAAVRPVTGKDRWRVSMQASSQEPRMYHLLPHEDQS